MFKKFWNFLNFEVEKTLKFFKRLLNNQIMVKIFKYIFLFYFFYFKFEIFLVQFNTCFRLFLLVS